MLRSSKLTMTPSERGWLQEMNWKRKDQIIYHICQIIIHSYSRYCFNMKSTIEGRSVRQKMTTSDLKTVENACDEALR